MSLLIINKILVHINNEDENKNKIYNYFYDISVELTVMFTIIITKKYNIIFLLT